MRRLTNRARALRQSQTETERALWQMLRGRRFAGWKFRRQVPIGPYVADFLCPAVRVIVAVDGSQHADNARDVLRDGWLAGEGYHVLRIWNRDVFVDPEGTATAIWAALEARRPPEQ